MLFRRTILPDIEERLFKGKVIVLYGPRRVGKTTLVKQISQKYPRESLYLNCDEPDVRQALTEKTSAQLISYIGRKKLVIIDEAQRVKNIGLTLKLLVENAISTQVIATGSSSFDLANKISEPLTDRSYEFFLPPLSLTEIYPDKFESDRFLEERLIYGSYPGIVVDPKSAREIIYNIYQKYLYKDALEYQGFKNPDVLERLLPALALQIGQEVSLTELANLVGIDQKTVSAYLRLLELAFVIFKLPPLSRNLRKEISKSRKIYFWDTGIRNSVINNFNPLNLRDDVGRLWENFLISERFKRNKAMMVTANTYFWRTWSKEEVDYVEEGQGIMSGFEIKWGKVSSQPRNWQQTYSHSTWQVVTRENYWDFIK